MNRPVERKVYASTIGAGAGLTVSNFVLWIVDKIWWPDPAVDIPLPVSAFAELVVTTGLAFLAGYFAKHDTTVIVEADSYHSPEIAHDLPGRGPDGRP